MEKSEVWSRAVVVSRKRGGGQLKPVAVAAVSRSDAAWLGVTVVEIVPSGSRLVVEGTPGLGGSVQLPLTRLA